jgi:hypothetical protein
MEPFDDRESTGHDLTDRELSGMLREWQAPRPPGAMRARALAGAGRPWWQRLWTASIRVPLPVAALLAVLFALAMWRWVIPVPARVLIQTERVEVPVAADKPRPAPTIYGLQPVAELRPRIIRSGHARN